MHRMFCSVAEMYSAQKPKVNSGLSFLHEEKMLKATKSTVALEFRNQKIM